MSSLAEVSRVAGVSMTTASRVLTSSTHPVAASTRERVLRAAEAVGYSPSALARGLVSRRSHLIGIIVSDIANPYFSMIARGVNDVALKAGYITMLSSGDRRATTEISQLKAMLEYRATGIIIAGSGYVGDGHLEQFAQVVDLAKKQGARVVTLASRSLNCRIITADVHSAAYDVTDYLISLGHRNIAFIEGPDILTTSQERRDGFMDCMAEQGLAENARVVSGGFDFEAGFQATMSLLLDKQPLDAIVAANDEAAVGALSALSQAGVVVPDEVSVAGIDDFPVARFVGLTTVSMPLYEMGAMAAREIVDGAGGKQEGQVETLTLLAHRLIPRRTSARPKKAKAESALRASDAAKRKLTQRK